MPDLDQGTAPLAFVLEPAAGPAPLAVSLRCTDPRAAGQLVTWDFGDGQQATDPAETVQQHIYQAAGNFAVTATAGPLSGQAVIPVSQRVKTGIPKPVRILGLIAVAAVVLGIGISVLTGGFRLSSTGSGAPVAAGQCGADPAAGNVERYSVRYFYGTGLAFDRMLSVAFPFSANGLTVKAAEGGQLQVYCGQVMVLNAAMHFCGYPPGTGRRLNELTAAGATTSRVGNNTVYASSQFTDERYVFQGDNEVSGTLSSVPQYQEAGIAVLGTLTMDTRSCSDYSQLAADNASYLLAHAADPGVLVKE